MDEDIFDRNILSLALNCILESWLALRYQFPLYNAEINLEAVAECGRDRVINITWPRLG